MKICEPSDQLIDQLVDGCLSGEQYRQALQALEANPSRWRDCALAFLREQAVSAELKQLAGSQVDWQAQTVVQRPLRPAAGERLDRVSSRRAASRLSRWGALAGLILLGLAIGWPLWSGRSGQMVVETSPLNQPLQSRSTIAAGAAGDQAASGTFAMTPSQVTEENSSTRRNKADRSGNSYASWLPVDNRLPSRLRELEERGHIRVDSSNALIPIDYEDGTSLWVPVQQLRIEPTVFAY